MMDISISLFEECNNNCYFCYNGINKFNIDYMKFDTKDYINTIANVITKAGNSRITPINIEIIGGELFPDKMTDKDFIKLVHFVRDICLEFNVKAITFTSNMMWSNPSITEKVKSLLSYFKDTGRIVRLMTSFDLCFRFNTDETLTNFYNNICTMRKWLKKNKFDDISASMVLMNRALTLGSYNFTPNATKLEYKTLSVFNKLLKSGMKFYVEFLEPISKVWYEEIPTHDNLLEFYEWILNNGYQDQFEILENVKYKGSKTGCSNIPHCGNPYCILAKAKTATSCWKWHNPDAKDDLFNVELKKSFYRKFKCVLCPYYKKCKFTCFRFGKLQETNKCVYRTLYDKYGIK